MQDGYAIRDGRPSSISFLRASAQTNPTQALSLALTLTLAPTVWGLEARPTAGKQGRSRGSAACFWWRSCKKHPGRPKGQPRAIRQTSVTKFVACPSCICRASQYPHGITKKKRRALRFQRFGSGTTQPDTSYIRSNQRYVSWSDASHSVFGSWSFLLLRSIS